MVIRRVADDTVRVDVGLGLGHVVEAMVIADPRLMVPSAMRSRIR
jgi:hypothetical protein